MENFKSEFNIGEIHRRDKWQFELKSEFFHSAKLKKNVYKQEFYFFIPNSLQINQDSYSQNQFYRDQTNLIRYKTPEFTIEELLNPNNEQSPLYRISAISQLPQSPGNIEIIEDEIKLLGNILRSLLRRRAHNILVKIGDSSSDTYSDVAILCQDVSKIKSTIPEIEKKIRGLNGNTLLHKHFTYTNEFISNAILFYLSGLLEKVRKSNMPQQKEIDDLLSQAIQDELPSKPDQQKEDEEYIFYKLGLLNKFILDVLMLDATRTKLYSKYNNIFAAIAAGIAMMFFLILFIWQGRIFIIDSLPFVAITVILYIAKDRIKEGIRNLSYRHFHRWFPDYKIEIRSPNDKYVLGTIEESFSFISEQNLPKEIVSMRHREFHLVLEEIKRPERIIYYKKKIILMHPPRGVDIRKNAINIIFRFNISNFIQKADNPFHNYLSIDKVSGEIRKRKLPKVYHLNIILKNSYIDEFNQERQEFKKFRLILDKNGIKRLEQVTSFKT